MSEVAEGKVLGLGSLVRVADQSPASTFTTVGVVRAMTPPPIESNTVDGSSLEDERERLDPGTKKATDFTFTQFWKVGDANAAVIDALAVSREGRVWQEIYPTATTPTTRQFTGWVKRVAPSVSGPNEYWSREVVVQSTSDSEYVGG
jgi:hypothetical protein